MWWLMKHINLPVLLLLNMTDMFLLLFTECHLIGIVHLYLWGGHKFFPQSSNLISFPIQEQRHFMQNDSIFRYSEAIEYATSKWNHIFEQLDKIYLQSINTWSLEAINITQLWVPWIFIKPLSSIFLSRFFKRFANAYSVLHLYSSARGRTISFVVMYEIYQFECLFTQRVREVGWHQH